MKVSVRIAVDAPVLRRTCQFSLYQIAQFSNAWQDAGLKVMGHIVWTKNYASRARHTRYCHESAYLLTKGYPQLPENPMTDVQS